MVSNVGHEAVGGGSRSGTDGKFARTTLSRSWAKKDQQHEAVIQVHAKNNPVKGDPSMSKKTKLTCKKIHRTTGVKDKHRSKIIHRSTGLRNKPARSSSSVGNFDGREDSETVRVKGTDDKEDFEADGSNDIIEGSGESNEVRTSRRHPVGDVDGREVNGTEQCKQTEARQYSKADNNGLAIQGNDKSSEARSSESKLYDDLDSRENIETEIVKGTDDRENVEVDCQDIIQGKDLTDEVQELPEPNLETDNDGSGAAAKNIPSVLSEAQLKRALLTYLYNHQELLLPKPAENANADQSIQKDRDPTGDGKPVDDKYSNATTTKVPVSFVPAEITQPNNNDNWRMTPMGENVYGDVSTIMGHSWDDSTILSHNNQDELLLTWIECVAGTRACNSTLFSWYASLCKALGCSSAVELNNSVVHFEADDKVDIVGLKSRPELNGKVGTVVAIRPDGRVVVAVQPGPEGDNLAVAFAALKPKNLVKDLFMTVQHAKKAQRSKE